MLFCTPCACNRNTITRNLLSTGKNVTHKLIDGALYKAIGEQGYIKYCFFFTEKYNIICI